MAKVRFDSDVYDQDWFLEMSRNHRDFFFYMIGKFHPAGVWVPKFAAVKMKIGEVDKIQFIKEMEDANMPIVVLPNGNWFDPGYVKRHQGIILNPENNYHSTILRIFEENNINLDEFGYSYPAKKTEVIKESLSLEEKRVKLKAKYDKFVSEVKAYVVDKPQYSDELVKTFIAYWCQPNKSHTQLGFEMEKKWSLSLRLSTFLKNENRRSGAKKEDVKDVNFLTKHGVNG